MVRGHDVVVKGIILIKQLRMEHILCTIIYAGNSMRAFLHDRQGNHQNNQQIFWCAAHWLAVGFFFLFTAIRRFVFLFLTFFAIFCLEQFLVPFSPSGFRAFVFEPNLWKNVSLELLRHKILEAFANQFKFMISDWIGTLNIVRMLSNRWWWYGHLTFKKQLSVREMKNVLRSIYNRKII